MYDPTQPVPPPIEPTRYDDLTPPPPPLDPASLPYFQAQQAQRTRQSTLRTRRAIMVLSILALLAVTAGVYGAVQAARDSGANAQPTPYPASDYTTWLQQEHTHWQEQGDPVVYAAFSDTDWQILNVATLNTNEQDARDLCQRIASDYVARFHAAITVRMTDNEATYLSFSCTASP
jgi:hypothetical protein